MKKLSSIALSLVLATAMMGAGYAAWGQTLSLSNAVNTGNFKFTLSNGTVTPDPTTGSYLETKTAIADANNGVLNVSITNAYPGAKASVSETITNDSTIPAKLTLANTIPPEFNLSNINVNGTLYTAGMNIPTGNVLITYDLTANDNVKYTTDYTISSAAAFEQNTNTPKN